LNINRKIILIYDKNVRESKLYQSLKHDFGKVCLIYNKKNDASILNWLKGSFKAVFKAEKHDIIICWFDFQAVLC